QRSLRDAIASRFPDYARLTNPPPATVAEAQAALAPGEALLATYVATDKTYIWAVPKDGPVAFATAPLSRSEIDRTVKDLRKALECGARRLMDYPVFDIALAHGLYGALLEPVQLGWRGAKNLLVVPDGALAQLPFGLLVTAPARLPADREGTALFAGYTEVP